MKFLNREEIEEKILKKFGKSFMSSNILRKAFESECSTPIYEYDGNKLALLKRFLANCDISKVIIFPDGSWQDLDEKNESLPVKFNTVKEAIDFLEEHLFGAYDYYVIYGDFEWVLTICHEADLHISGTKKFVEEFKKNYL